MGVRSRGGEKLKKKRQQKIAVVQEAEGKFLSYSESAEVRSFCQRVLTFMPAATQDAWSSASQASLHGSLLSVSACNDGRLASCKARIMLGRPASDTLAEWLRRRPAKPMGSPRAGSNPAGVALLHVLNVPGDIFEGHARRAVALWRSWVSWWFAKGCSAALFDLGFARQLFR